MSSLKGFVQIHQGLDHLLEAVGSIYLKLSPSPWLITTDRVMMQEMHTHSWLVVVQYEYQTY